MSKHHILWDVEEQVHKKQSELVKRQALLRTSIDRKLWRTTTVHVLKKHVFWKRDWKKIYRTTFFQLRRINWDSVRSWIWFWQNPMQERGSKNGKGNSLEKIGRGSFRNTVRQRTRIGERERGGGGSNKKLYSVNWNWSFFFHCPYQEK